jgi:hypothetical protein
LLKAGDARQREVRRAFAAHEAHFRGCRHHVDLSDDVERLGARLGDVPGR